MGLTISYKEEMDIIKNYYDKVYGLINQIEISEEHLDYIALKIYESIKSVYIFAKKTSESIEELCESNNIALEYYLKNVIKDTQNTEYLRDNIRQTILCSFIDSLDCVFEDFSNEYPESETIIHESCERLKKLCSAQKTNLKESDYWEETEFEKIITDTDYAKFALVDLYLVLSLFVVYCIKSNGKVFSILTASKELSQEDINVLSDFYQRGEWNKIQFFLPIEADVTLSYFMYRYIFPSNLYKTIGDLWSMGNGNKKSIPESAAQIIRIVNGKDIPSDKMPSKYKTFNTKVKELCKIGIFDSDNINNEEEIKILRLINFMKVAYWDKGKKDTVNMDLIKFLEKPNAKYFKTFGTHVVTRDNLVGTILLSELLKELSLCDIHTYMEMCLHLELNIKHIRKNLEECFKNNYYHVALREKINDAILFGLNNDSQIPQDIEVHPLMNPVLLLFIKLVLIKSELLIEELIQTMKFVSDKVDDLIISVYPDWDDNPQQQKNKVVFREITPENFMELVKNIEVFKEPAVSAKESGKVDNFFRLYFPEKAFIEGQCTEREYLSVYELINDVRDNSTLPKNIKSAFAAKTVPQHVTLTRELALSKIQNHNISGNYNGMFIPTFINTMNLFVCLLNHMENSCLDKLKSNQLYRFSNQVNKCVMELGKYLFGRGIFGLRYSDIDKTQNDIEIDPEWQKIFDDYFAPYFKKLIDSYCDRYKISEGELRRFLYEGLL